MDVNGLFPWHLGSVEILAYHKQRVYTAREPGNGVLPGTQNGPVLMPSWAWVKGLLHCKATSTGVPDRVMFLAEESATFLSRLQ